MKDKELIEGFLKDMELSNEERDAWQRIYDEHYPSEASASHEQDHGTIGRVNKCTQ
jgi:hypothetical protein